MELKIYRDKDEVAKQFSEYFSGLVEGKSIFHVALSGGSTPKIVFDLLAADFSSKIDWNKIHFYWGDERCVPPTNDQSNYKMTVAHLFSKVDVPQEHIHRILGENDPHKEAKRYGELLVEHLPSQNGTPQFDLVILGMGDDGHTASIFPHEIELWDSNENCEVAIHPDSGQRRVTLTGKVINNAKEVVFLVTGESKSEKITAILEKKEGHMDYPASLVHPNSGSLVWFMDADAAKELA
ncbi:6-phosphogluconolactonase [Flagellimonas sp. HMM57]|uniref:6-phosphogluconolactonase n=1 Tax=unclassified Flagellimonas TaxID=2644544 RepID=UPI0013D87B25|nr:MULTISPECIES: 6-phosphogluconolactonase [unclassified Flagellimonas]UII75517.1 6-phosphogluconolactonase [Flagellimonas sp. HMM57]